MSQMNSVNPLEPVIVVKGQHILDFLSVLNIFSQRS